MPSLDGPLLIWLVVIGLHNGSRTLLPDHVGWRRTLSYGTAPMSLNQAEAFFLFALVAAVTPGPSNTLILAIGSTVGAQRGLPCVLGAATGMSALLFCSTLGLGQLIIAQPT